MLGTLPAGTTTQVDLSTCVAGADIAGMTGVKVDITTIAKETNEDYTYNDIIQPTWLNIQAKGPSVFQDVTGGIVYGDETSPTFVSPAITSFTLHFSEYVRLGSATVVVEDVDGKQIKVRTKKILSTQNHYK